MIILESEDNVYVSCDVCKHLVGITCKAFPEKIPDEIFMDEIAHIDPYPGDNGIQFEFKDETE
jgi:hypothetical protein